MHLVDSKAINQPEPWHLQKGKCVVGFGLLMLGQGGRVKSHMEHRIQNLESSIQNKAALSPNVAPVACAGFKATTATKRIFAANSRSQLREPLQAVAAGRMVGKRTGFSHFEAALTRLFPLASTQVVDFPRMYDVSQAELGTNMGK